MEFLSNNIDAIVTLTFNRIQCAVR